MKFLSYIFPQTIFQSSSAHNKKIEVREINGRNVLLVNGIQQAGGYTEKLWKKALRNIQAKHILVFGVGGGTVFAHFPNADITAVDIDSEIIRIGKKYFGLDKITNLRLIEEDARDFVTAEKYDIIIIDLYIGNDVPSFVQERAFLLKLKMLLSTGGRLIINYYSPDLVQELTTLFSKVEHRPVLRNILVYVLK